MSQAIADSPAFWVALTGGLTVLYIVPTLIGIFRHVECFGLVIILNTFPIAWTCRAGRGLHDASQGRPRTLPQTV